jgi:hypothetical protein
MSPLPSTFTAFNGNQLLASGDLSAVLAQTKPVIDGGSHTVLVFNDHTGQPRDFDWRGSIDDVLSRLASDDLPAVPAPRGPGRPKLGVVAREVTLLPRHWDWLASQPGGASVALRKLVDAARHANAGADDQRQRRDAAYRFINAIAGHHPQFEDATRALFAGDMPGFEAAMASWPDDVQAHAKRLAASTVEVPGTPAG